MEHMLTQCPRLCFQTHWKWDGAGRERGKKQFLSNFFSHYVVRQPTTRYLGNIFLIFICAIDSIYIWLFISFSIYNLKYNILEGVVLTSDLAIDSSWCLMCCLWGLLEPILSFVLVKCKHMTFPGLVLEPPQMKYIEPAIVKEEKKWQFWCFSLPASDNHIPLWMGQEYDQQKYT